MQPITRALIVDDSRTAQLRLKKLLSPYKLEVDLAASAEEALGYLSYRMPSVIFMDHHMEGMDGFAALRIIKDNPATATIPVIMYTSISDKVYAGQAHALGALDTLTKNLMKPSRIEKVLSKLNIYRKEKPSPDTATATAGIKPSKIENNAQLDPPPPPSLEVRDRLSASEFKAQIARLFELHIADVRSQITENTKFIVRRLAGEIRNIGNQEGRVDDVPVSIIDEEARAQSSKMGLVSNALLCLILVGLAAISLQLFQSHRQLDEIRQITSTGSATSNRTPEDVENLVLPVANASETSGNPLLDTISWAIAADMHFNYREAPLSERQVLQIQTLIYRLYEAGLRGVIELDIHLGNFCLAQASNGELDLAPPDMPTSTCTFVRDQDRNALSGNYTNLAYVQFEQASEPIRNGDIEIVFNANAFENPIFAYPEIVSASAAEWNAVAARNQQIVVKLDGLE